MTCRVGIAWLIALAMTPLVLAQEFYSATAPRFFAPSDVNSMFYNLPGSRPRILFDDVTVSFANNSSRFHVTKVTVKISRDSFAPAVTITPYYSRIVPDASFNGGSSDFSDFPDVNLPTAFATPFDLAAKGSSSFSEQLVTFGTGLSTLFVVSGNTIGNAPGMHNFALGLELSDPDTRNGWTLAQQANNLDLLWDYVSPTNFSEFTYATDSMGNLIVGTQYLQVEGHIFSGADANSDGRVDLRDLVALAIHWQQPADYTGGDFNFDGIVNSTDLAMLARDWQSTVNFGGALSLVGLDGVVVPEPTSLSLLGLALPLLGFRRSGASPLR